MKLHFVLFSLVVFLFAPISIHARPTQEASSTDQFAKILAQTIVESLSPEMVTNYLQAETATPPPTLPNTSWGKETVFLLREAAQVAYDGADVTMEKLNSFASSPAGKITIAIIVFKVIGSDIFLIFGFVVGMIGFSIFTVSLYRAWTKPTIKETTGEGKDKKIVYGPPNISVSPVGYNSNEGECAIKTLIRLVPSLVFLITSLICLANLCG